MTVQGMLFRALLRGFISAGLAIAAYSYSPFLGFVVLALVVGEIAAELWVTSVWRGHATDLLVRGDGDA